jgi:hypothetical protein
MITIRGLKVVGPRVARARLVDGDRIGHPAGVPNWRARISVLKPAPILFLYAAADLTHFAEQVAR